MLNYDLSIIIVSYNTQLMTINCLKSIEKFFSGSLSYEIIVVDNNSTDGSADQIQSEFSNVKLIKNSENYGFGKANNQGVQIACGRYYLFLNSDTIILDDNIKNIMSLLDNNANIGIATGIVLNTDKSFQYPYKKIPNIIYILFVNTFALIHHFYGIHNFFIYYKYRSKMKKNYVDSVTGAYMLVTKSCFEKIGGFDESIFMYYEDTLLCYKALKNNYKIIYVPDAPVLHFGGGSFQGFEATSDRAYKSFQGSLYFIHEIYGKFIQNIYLKSVIVFWAMFFLIFKSLSFFPFDKMQKKKKLFSELLGYISKKQ